MAEHLTEEEQLEALKRWWAENGKGIVTGVVLALAAYFGFQFWESNERASAESASNLYQGFVEAISANEGNPNEAQRTTANSLADQLKEEFGDRIYATQAALGLAAMAAEGNNLEAAEQQLQWVLDNGTAPELVFLAKRRLAAVKAARGDADAGLKLLEGTVPEAFAALYAETRGDILLQQGDKAGAKIAYDEALAKLLPEQAGSAQILQLKADSVAAAAPKKDETAEQSAEPEQGTQESDEQ